MKVKAKIINPEGRSWTKGWFWSSPVRTGISFGTALAMVLSYAKNESILWAIIHGILSWLYVIYRIILKIWFV